MAGEMPVSEINIYTYLVVFYLGRGSELLAPSPKKCEISKLSG